MPPYWRNEMAKNKSWSATAKFEIILQVLKNDQTLNEICTHYQVSPSQVHTWKKQFIENGVEIFDKKRDKVVAKTLADHEQKQCKLHETIGELTVERDFLKKNWEKFQRNNGSN